jgi:hypothetical protein
MTEFKRHADACDKRHLSSQERDVVTLKLLNDIYDSTAKLAERMELNNYCYTEGHICIMQAAARYVVKSILAATGNDKTNVHAHLLSGSIMEIIDDLDLDVNDVIERIQELDANREEVLNAQ